MFEDLEAKSRIVLELCDGQIEPGRSRPLVVGLQAPQGSGKTTLVTHLIARLPERGWRGAAMSIDDFYLTRAEQIHLAEGHPGNPYLEHRGYPGTHDIALGAATLAALRSLGPDSAGQVARIPVYDKTAHDGRGDRRPESEWREVEGPLDVIFVEGWMLGFTPVPEATIRDPFLIDPNRALADYERWYKLIDAMVVIRATDPTFVLRWRVEAEEATKAKGLPGLSREAIEDYVRRFLPAYAMWGGRAERWPATRVLPLVVGGDRKLAGSGPPAPSPKDLFLLSLARCQGKSDFIPRFYRRFTAASEEVAFKFRFTDFQRQQHMLSRSLELCAEATAGYSTGLAELTARADSHSRAHLDIPPHLYDLWLSALVQTAAECDPEWTPDVQTAWRTILSFAIMHMTHRYDHA